MCTALKTWPIVLSNLPVLIGFRPQAGQCGGFYRLEQLQHLEAYYAVSGSGMVMHTCNLVCIPINSPDII
jgi:hypothetical protein